MDSIFEFMQDKGIVKENKSSRMISQLFERSFDLWKCAQKHISIKCAHYKIQHAQTSYAR